MVIRKDCEHLLLCSGVEIGVYEYRFVRVVVDNGLIRSQRADNSIEIISTNIGEKRELF